MNISNKEFEAIANTIKMVWYTNYDVIEEPLKVKIMGEKLKNFVIFSSKKCDVFDFKSVTV